MLKRILIGLSIFILSILVLASSFLFWVYKNPEGAFHLAEKYILPEDLKITWKKLDFSGASLENWNFFISLDIEDFKVTKGAPEIIFPVDKISIKANLFSLDRKVHFQKLHVVTDSEVYFKPDPNAKPSDPMSPYEQFQDLKSYLDLVKNRIEVEDLIFKISKMTFQPLKGNPISAQFSLTSQNHQIWDLEFSGQIPGESPLNLKGTGHLDLEKSLLNMKVKAEGSGLKSEQELDLTYDKDLVKLSVKGPIGYKKKTVNLSAQPLLLAQLTEDEIHLKLTGSLSGVSKSLDKLEKLEAEIKIPQENGRAWSEDPSTFSLKGPVDIFFLDKKSREALERSCQCQLPESLIVQSQGQFWMDVLTSESDDMRPAVDGEVSIESLRNRLFAIDLSGRMKIEKQKSQWIYTPALTGSVDVFSFKGFHPLFAAHRILIPAPLDVLDGTLNLKIGSPVEQKFPITLDIDLLSKNQKVKINSSASAFVHPNFKEADLSIDTKVYDLQLELPPLDPVRGIPRITPDSRVQLRPEPAKSKASTFKLNMDFQISTASPGSIRLLSKYFKPNLPLSLDVRAVSSKSSDGFVQVEPFDIVYLRRTVRVERLKLNLTETKDDEIPVSGRFKVQQSEYKVHVDLSGTTKNPTIKMSSEPYLPESEIISVLLYDRTSDELISADAETAGSVQAAVADRAIGLFGLWAFASTPIKSFSYNPVTRVYSATVDVGDNLTAGIGTNWESATQLELRRRVSDKWVLTAMWMPATQEAGQSTKLVLQWENRY